jgi:flavin reductase (NADH)/flavin reductase/chlorophenol-4-monooxygenase component 1
MTVRAHAETIITAPVAGRSSGAAPESVPATEFRVALTGLATAVSIIATDGPAGRAGLTCSAVCGISDTPATVLACVNRRSTAHAVIQKNGVMCINTLPAALSELSQAFAGVGQIPMADRFKKATWDALVTGAPHCTSALTAFDCELIEVREIGTHSVLIGRVLATAQSATAVEPLIHHRQQYATTRVL